MNGKAAALLAALVLSLLVAAGSLYWILRQREWVVRIPEAQLQEALDQRFPVEKRHLLIFTVRYSNPRIRWQEGSERLQASLDAETLFRVDDRPFTGSAAVSGVLAYDPGSGEFRLGQAKVERLSIGGLPEEHAGLVAQAGSLMLQEHLDRAPLYRLRPTDVKQAAARLVLKQIVTRDGHLEVTLGLP